MKKLNLKKSDAANNSPLFLPAKYGSAGKDVLYSKH